MFEVLKRWFSVKNPIDSIFEGIDRLHTSDQEKGELRLQAIKLELERQENILKDKQSARAMYNKDAIMQKLFSFVFLVAFFVIAWYMLQLYTGDLEITEVASNFIYAVFGAISSYMTMIVSFFFGSSAEGNSSNSNNVKNG
jgi:multidrug transporter EmrE-like cation transporter